MPASLGLRAKTPGSTATPDAASTQGAGPRVLSAEAASGVSLRCISNASWLTDPGIGGGSSFIASSNEVDLESLLPDVWIAAHPEPFLTDRRDEAEAAALARRRERRRAHASEHIRSP